MPNLIRVVPRRCLFLAVAASTAAAPTSRPEAEHGGCASPAFSRLSFWLGEWDVFVGDRLAGSNRISPVLGGCALLEEWSAATGGEGRSLFWVAPEDRRWRQTWVTNAPFSPGGVKEKREVLDATLPRGAVRFVGTVRDTLGRQWLDRTTLTPEADGTARQLIEISTDAGTTWRATFDGSYRRRLPTGLDRLSAINVEFSRTDWLGRPANRIVPDSGTAEPLMAMLRDTIFTTGTIELDVGGEIPHGASASARGFVGVAVRVRDLGQRAQSFYLRLSNGRAEGQLQRNRAVQYQAMPEFPWSRLREETPGAFESAADVAPGQWTRLRLVVRRESARLYLDGASVATLVVNDLKTPDREGAVALWIGPETIGYFGGLRISADTTYPDAPDGPR